MTNRYTDAGGRVALLYSPGHGAGWYSWHHNEELIYDPYLVDLVLHVEDEVERMERIDAYLTLKYPNEYISGAENLEVCWVDPGTRFIIDEYDGAESIVMYDRMRWLTA